MMESSNIWPFLTLSVTHYRLEKQRKDVYKWDILQQQEEKWLKKETPKHLAFSDVSISIVVYYFFEHKKIM